MYVQDLIIEVTRKCNLQCQHCLRGNVQRKNINVPMIEEFLVNNEILSVGSLVLTGGEPFLNPKGIIDLSMVFKKYDISLSSFYIATNGTVSPIPAIQGLCNFFDMTDDIEYFRIDISSDEYHEYEGIDMHPAWNLITHGSKEGPSYNAVIAEGRGKELNRTGRTVEDDEWVWEDGDLTEGMIYINALGMICKACDYSYKTQSLRNHGYCLSKPLKEF